MMVLLHGLILSALGLMVIVLAVNLVSFRTAKASTTGNRPRVSVLIPARNEEETVGRCLATLVQQDYPDYEVLVLDDRSTDATVARVREWEQRDPRVRLIPGASLPEGWVGKSFACHQLSEAAIGEMLLFVDADTVHSPSSIGSAVAEMERTRAGLLSLIPHQTMISFWETVVLPLLHFVTMCFLPFSLVSSTRNPRFAMANGQFMLFRRDVYRSIGGHAAVRTAMVEDVWLSRLVKRSGHRLVIMDGGPVVSCRMYRSFSGIWQGFSKNLFPGFNYSLPAIGGVMAFLAITSVLPFLLLPAALLGGVAGFLLTASVAEVALLIGIRVALAARFRMPWLSSLLHPLGVSMVIAIAANSCRWVVAGGGARWKGRVYDFRSNLSIHS